MTASVSIGERIGGYRVISLLGEGGMGAVYRAQHEGATEEVALKVLSPELAEAGSFRDRFLRESRYARSVDHPNVVRVRDSGEDEGRLYIAMDLVEGTDLKTLLALEGTLDPERALLLLAQAGAALDAVHERGLVHRDVKPANLIASLAAEGEEERCSLTDFGLSKAPTQDSRRLTARGKFVGTYHYTAPEQILATDHDHRADVYSLGCVLFECLTGETPFRHETMTEILHAHVDEPPPQPTDGHPELPDAIDEVIVRALAKDPNERFASCGELIAAARQALAPAPIAGAQSPPPKRLAIEVTAGNAAGTRIEVEDELAIGRAAEGAGQLSDDRELSRRHARVFRGETGFMIEDLGSSNGTYLNGIRLGEPAPLADRDRIELGGTTLLVEAIEGISVAGLEPETTEPAGADATTTPAPEAAVPLGARPLRLEIDIEAGEVRLWLDGSEEPVRIVSEDGRWRVSPGD